MFTIWKLYILNSAHGNIHSVNILGPQHFSCIRKSLLPSWGNNSLSSTEKNVQVIPWHWQQLWPSPLLNLQLVQHLASNLAINLRMAQCVYFSINNYTDTSCINGKGQVPCWFYHFTTDFRSLTHQWESVKWEMRTCNNAWLVWSSPMGLPGYSWTPARVSLRIPACPPPPHI